MGFNDFVGFFGVAEIDRTMTPRVRPSAFLPMGPRAYLARLKRTSYSR